MAQKLHQDDSIIGQNRDVSLNDKLAAYSTHQPFSHLFIFSPSGIFFNLIQKKIGEGNDYLKINVFFTLQLF